MLFVSNTRGIILLFILIVISIFMVHCEKSEDVTIKKSKPASTMKEIILNQDDREFHKAGDLNIKTRSTISYFYNNRGVIGEKGFLVERVSFDDKGNRIEHINYKSNGDIDLKWNYKYDDNGNLVRSETYNVFDALVSWSESEIDELGYEVDRSELNRTIKGICNIKFVYDESGYLDEKRTFNVSDKLLNKEKYEYDELGHLSKKIMYNGEDKITSEFLIEYDSAGYLLKEFNNISGIASTTTTYTYDDNGNVIVKDGGYFSQKFWYDKNGNVTEEHLYDKDGYRQQKFTYTYDQRNLLIEKVRYDFEDKPFLYIKYEYEFF